MLFFCYLLQLHPLLMVVGFILVGGEGKQSSIYAKLIIRYRLRKSSAFRFVQSH